jgi:translation initiation factor 1A
MSNFGDFKEIREEVKAQPQPEGEEFAPARVRMPRGKEVIGVVAQRLGGNRMEIRTTDGRVMNCRVPGRFKRKFWLRVGDVVIAEPWENETDKGDIVFQYSKGAAFQLRKRGILKDIEGKF